ncbi:hypothetical protein Clacol_005483 [Clathrus columnatus]|uniref:Major facilitator superfamily (MFS) profile domain-containing protein n=1 Tax=Clathrus columnatus TaxID=1419009 RepID=A0AAV5A9G9_9AGAM|nr:hypothetical protein Clacol_005483 [Clathrus columnatus]
MPGGPVATSAAFGATAPKSYLAGILMTAFAAFGGILFGYDTGTISGIIAMPDWLCSFGHPIRDPNGQLIFMDGVLQCAITTAQSSLVVSILSAGTFFGALAGAPVADYMGRRMGIIFSSAVFCLGIALQTASTKLPLFCAGRVFAGLGVGLVSCLIPMYQSECAPKWIRGAVVSGYQFAITIGILLANVFNNATHARRDHSSYRIPIAIQFIWAAILAAGMLFLPESPRYLIKKRDSDGAARAMGRLLSSPPDSLVVQSELDIIKENLREEEEIGQSSYLDCFRSGNNNLRFRVLTGIALQAWQQLTGINFIFYYGTTFFQNSGLKDPFIDSVATSVVNVGMTIPGIYFIERIGRRDLLLIGAAGMVVCEYIVAIVGVTVSSENVAGQKVLIAFVCIYIAFFAATWGPIAWVVTGEIFPLNVRAKAISLATASNWLWNWAIAFATPYLVIVGKGDAGLQVKVFFIWGSTCLGCLLFTYFCIPETKGLSLEQIDELYKRSTPQTSKKVRLELLAEERERERKISEKGDFDSHSDTKAEA